MKKIKVEITKQRVHFGPLYNISDVKMILCVGVTSTLVRRPLNTAVVQGSAVTLQCNSDDSNSYLLWFNSSCVTSKGFSNCLNDVIYTGFTVRDNFRPRVHVTAANNATHGTRDLNINSTQLTDAGVYLCTEQLPGVSSANWHSSSARLIVLGK